MRRIGSRPGARSLWAGFDDERCAAALHAGADRGTRTTDGCRPVVGRRSLDFGHRSFRIPCYRLLGSPAALPGGDAILVDEVENPLRSDEELWAAAQWLGRGQRDLDLVRRWIESGSERQLRGGLTLLRNIDPRRLPDGAIDEAKRLVALAAERPRLPAHAADDVIGFVEGFRDRALAPSLLGLVQHPDPEVRDRSRAVLAKLRA